MAGQIRLFEKTAAGLLAEVAPENVGATSGRRRQRVSMQCDVLFAADEEAARDAEEVAASAQQDAEAETERKKNADRDAGVAKLEAIGLSPEEIRAILGR